MYPVVRLKTQSGVLLVIKSRIIIIIVSMSHNSVRPVKFVKARSQIVLIRLPSNLLNFEKTSHSQAKQAYV